MILRFIVVTCLAALSAGFTPDAYAGSQGSDCSFYMDMGLTQPFHKPVEAPRLMIVAPRAGSLHFLKGGYVMEGSDNLHGCPSDAAICQRKAYLAAGDAVIITSTNGAYSCATYTGSSPDFRMTSGFVATAALAAPPTEPAPSWLGEWKVSYDRVIHVTPAEGGALKLSLQSYFPDIPSDGTETPFVTTMVTPSDTAIAFSVQDSDDASTPAKSGAVGADPANDQICRVQLWRLGPYIVDTDNGCLLGNSGTSGGVYRPVP